MYPNLCDSFYRRLSVKDDLQAVYPSHVDVELPTKYSRPFTILLSLSSKQYQEIKLPIHFRYHLPGDKKFIRVDLDAPLLYINCKNNYAFLSDNRKQTYCLDGLNFINKTSSLDQDCNWMQIDYNAYLKSPLRVNIPIGDVSLYEFVTYITIIIGWIGCACILFTANNKIKGIQKKLSNYHSN